MLSVWSLCLMYGTIGFTGNFFITAACRPTCKCSQRAILTAGDDELALVAIPLACGVVETGLRSWAGSFPTDWSARTGNRKWGRRIVGSCGLALGCLALLGTIWVEDPERVAGCASFCHVLRQ